MGTLTIRLDDKLERELNRLAKTQHKTKSEIEVVPIFSPRQLWQRLAGAGSARQEELA